MKKIIIPKIMTNDESKLFAGMIVAQRNVDYYEGILEGLRNKRIKQLEAITGINTDNLIENERD